MSDEAQLKQYIVEFDILDPYDPVLYAGIPDQRQVVNDLFTSGKLVTYTLTMDRSKLWAIFVVSAESELINLIDRLPLSQYMDYQYKELMFHQSIRLLPTMSLN